MFKDVNIKQILRVMLVVLFAAFMLTACEQDDSIGGRSRAAMAAPVGEDPVSEETMKNASNAHRECWQTGMIDLLYQNMGKIAMGMYAKITDGALPLMMIAFALWTIFRLLKFVGSFTEDSPAEIWNEIVRKLFVCLICGLIASSTTQILWLLNTVVFPIYYAFLELGAAILNSAGDGSNFKAGSTVLNFFQEKLTLNEPVMCSAPAIGKASIESLSFPDGPRTMMNCMICTVNERLTLGFFLSFKVMDAPGFMSLITGLFILICFTIVKLGFIFYLVDSIFRFTMMAIILPILVMSYAFKQTSSWAKNGFLTIINSAALMMFMAIMMSMALLAMERIITDNSDIFNDNANEMSFSEFSIPFMCIMLVGFLISSSVNLAQQVTDSLVGGNSDSLFQKRVGTFVMWTLNLITLGAAKRVINAGKKVLGMK
jgi:membrane protein